MAEIKIPLPTNEQVEISNTLKKINNYSEPYPMIIYPTLSPLDGSRRIKWRDKNGTLYATNSGNLIQKSNDEGTTWNTVLTVVGGDLASSGLMVTDTGRIIFGDYATRSVYVSNVEQTSYSLGFAFLDGQGLFSQQLAHCIHENIVLIGSYNPSAVANSSREVWLSKDYGVTWEHIFTAPVINPNVNCHIHDVEYDIYDKRIWIATGDHENKNMFYSDDFGQTFVTIFDSHSHPKNTQNTQIIAYEHGVIFGSDDQFVGLHYWKKQKGQRNAFVNPNDIEIQFYKYNTPTADHFACRRWVIRNEKYNYTLIPFSQQLSQGFSRLLVSMNGLDWFEIYTNDTVEPGLRTIVGFDFNKPDDEKFIYGLFQKADNSWRTFKAKAPMFYNVKAIQEDKENENTKDEYINLTITKTGAVGTSTSEYTDIYPEIGFGYELENISMEIKSPTGATTGTHELGLKRGTSSRPNVLFSTYEFAKDIKYDFGSFLNSPKTQLPLNADVQLSIMKGIIISQNRPLRITYSNKTDIVQNNDRVYNLSVRKFKL